MPKPIKRHKALQPISREHHHGLLLSWKIREGFRLDVAPVRIKKYTDWFWKNYLQSHFSFEEVHIFPLLGHDNKLIKRALREHGRLKGLFSAQDKIERNLSLIEEELVAHIRFEERVLFQEVQQIATEEQLEAIEKEHAKNVEQSWEDEFWVKKSK
jgi:iron-sulfur cluster repair protein YtfE (RIC family)